MLPLLVGGKRLVNAVIIDGEMPGEVAEGIVFGGEAAALKKAGMGAGTGTAGGVLGGMDGDESRPHVSDFVATVSPFGNESLGDAKPGPGKFRGRGGDRRGGAGKEEDRPQKSECWNERVGLKE